MPTVDEPQTPDVQDGGERRTQPTPSHAPLTPDLELREVRKGAKPGSRYVRLTPKSQRPFEAIDTGELRATAVAIRPRTPIEAVLRSLKRVVVGIPLATSQVAHERLSKLKALAVFASDNLSSSAYATEEILLVLLLAGTAAFTWSLPIAVAIVVLIAIVVISYSQVIRGYPHGGGSYAVARANLGTAPALTAGAALIVDYVLTVAVSTSAGVAAIISIAPELHDYRIVIAATSVFILTLANLRGIRESGSLFALPAYFFIASISAMIITGLVRLALGHDLEGGVPDHTLAEGTQAITLFLILRAFASGSAALTGIEAVSDGVPSFKPPEARNAGVTLAWMACILGFFFVGLTFLAHEMDVVPSETKTVVAQIADGVFGHNVLFFTVQIATTLILLLAANTSFAGLPVLGSVMARDRCLPKQFAFRGDRLAFSNGIIFLGVASIIFLVIFEADTHRLIPLYAVGVFTAFTLSQIGMVAHWRREGASDARLSLIVNAVGATATGVVLVIVASTKFLDGAWLTILAIAVLTFFLSRIHHHYQHVAEQLDVKAGDRPAPAFEAASDRDRERAVIMPIDEINQAVLQTIEFSRSLSNNVTAVHITDDVEEGEKLRADWEEKVLDTPIVIIESPYRSFLAPMLAYIDGIDRVDPGAYITVVLPEFVPAHFWEGLLHNQSASRLKRALIHRPNTVLINVPYHLR